MVLPAEVEANAIHAVRPTVYRKHQWILAGRVKVRWFDNPALDVEIVYRLVPDFFDLTEFKICEQRPVMVCQKGDIGRIVEIKRDNLSWLMIGSQCADRDASLGDIGNG